MVVWGYTFESFDHVDFNNVDHEGVECAQLLEFRPRGEVFHSYNSWPGGMILSIISGY